MAGGIGSESREPLADLSKMDEFKVDALSTHDIEVRDIKHNRVFTITFPPDVSFA
jgi:hypothetical protein